MQKKSKFALDDGDDDDDDDDEPTELLTHGGNALSSFDDFKDNISIEDDDDDAGCMVFYLYVWVAYFRVITDSFDHFVCIFAQKLTVLLRDCD